MQPKTVSLVSVPTSHVVERRKNICSEEGFSQFGGEALLGFCPWKLERPGSSFFLNLAGVSLP